jgi:hypothetical protein
MPDEPRATEEEQEQGPGRMEEEEDMRGATPAADPHTGDPRGDDDDQ